MAKIKEPAPASVDHHAQRLQEMQAQSAQHRAQEAEAERQRAVARDLQEKAARQDEIASLEKQAASAQGLDTREAILDKIRQMRNEPSAPPPVALGRHGPELAQFEAEQKAGREAVARAEAEQERVRLLRERLAAEEAAKTTTMQPQNPGQNQPFPASGATLK